LNTIDFCEGRAAIRAGRTSAMIECKDLAGKVVRSITLFDEGEDSPEVSIDFEDGSNFNASLSVKKALDAKLTCDDGGQPQLIKSYTNSAVSR
jgi:hypothetical protein